MFWLECLSEEYPGVQLMHWSGVCRQVVPVRSRRSSVAQRTGEESVRSQGQVPGGDQSKRSQGDSWGQTQVSREREDSLNKPGLGPKASRTQVQASWISNRNSQKQGDHKNKCTREPKINEQSVTGFHIKTVWCLTMRQCACMFQGASLLTHCVHSCGHGKYWQECQVFGHLCHEHCPNKMYLD